MKATLILLMIVISIGSYAQSIDYLAPHKHQLLQNIPYGPHKRNVFDIVLPISDKPTPVIIFIHGGAFSHGDKSKGWKRKSEVLDFLNHQIAYATINYRYLKKNDSLGVKACLADIKMALQYVRHHAERFNIDKKAVGCYGVSAGAGSSLYLGYHEDMVISGDTTLLGESTKPKVIGAIATQATYDILRWKKFIPGLQLAITMKRRVSNKSTANFYGYSDYRSFKPYRKVITRSLDMLAMIDSNDPPTYVINMERKTFPKNNNIVFHHRKHAIVLAKTLEKHGVEHCMYIYSKDTQKPSDVEHSVSQFLIEHLIEKDIDAN